jgi:hypothetical protein
MLARIEIKGNLAPIQEYGRHQTAAAKKRKDNKKKGKEPGEGEPNPNESSDNKPLYDDKYYDLDDGFIDDDEIVEDDGFGAELGEGASNFYSQFNPSVEPSSMQRLSAVAAGRKFDHHGQPIAVQGQEEREEAE